MTASSVPATWCSRCGRVLDLLPGAFAQAMEQYEGTACSSCGAVRCETCNPAPSQGGTLVCARCGGSLDPLFARDLGVIHEKHRAAILAWTERFRERTIRVEIGNRSATTATSAREETPDGVLFFDLIADGLITAVAQDIPRPGHLTVQFDSHVGGMETNDGFLVGYEGSGVDDDGDRLVIHKGAQVIRLVARPARLEAPFDVGAGDEAEPVPPAGHTVMWHDACTRNGCETCGGYGRFFVREPAARCPVCRGRGYAIKDEIYMGPDCENCLGTGWAGAVRPQPVTAHDPGPTPAPAPATSVAPTVALVADVAVAAEAPQVEDTSARPSVASLVELADVAGLIDRLYHPVPSAPKEYPPDMAPGLRELMGSLDEKIDPFHEDREETCGGLRALGAQVIPALIDELGTKDGEVGAYVSQALSGIGAPALPALVETVRSGPAEGVLSAGVTIAEIRERGVELPPDLVRTLVTIKMSPPVDETLRRQQAASHALGPLDAHSISDRVGLPEKAVALQAPARPAQPAPATQGTEPCKRCGGPVKSGDFTCPQCGNTRWGVLAIWAIVSVVCLGAAILWAPLIAGAWGTVVQWGGWIVGLVCLLVAVVGAVTGLRAPKRPPSA